MARLADTTGDPVKADAAQSPAPVQAAGCLLWRRTDADDDGATGVEVGLVHRQRHDDWSLPKGKLAREETWPVAAVREVSEETGHDVVLGPPLPSQHYVVEGAPKEVRYWAAEVTHAPEGGFLPNDEVDVLAWLPPEAARQQLSYAHDGQVLDAFLDLLDALDGAEPDVLIVLRHARAMKRAVWRGRDADRPLEDRGIEDSDALVPLLAAYGIETIHSSDTRRCLDTVAPFAAARHLAVTPEPSVSERGHRHKPEAAGRRTATLMGNGGRVLLCSHRPVLPEVLSAALGAEEGAAVIGDGLPPGALVVIHHVGERVLAVERHDP